MGNRYEKVFGVGLNKTGTSSLMQALKFLGFKHKPYDPILIELFFAGRQKDIFRRISMYESFEDWPWPLMVPSLLARYGETAKFILTKRSCSSAWIESLKRHSDITDPITNPRKRIYGYNYPHGNEEEHIRIYETHLVSVRKQFTDCGMGHLLIELCWESGDGWEELCSHLEMPIPRIAFPHANATRNHKKNHPNKIRNRLVRMNDGLNSKFHQQSPKHPEL